ncbi:hypothetical protein QOZ80_6AG0537710 [Eleusine coracana subsp. coracana]|nr:hypothetical protein QOZ80_6AG0537710 [Eleusine coracana subsp. coracana]
MAAAAATVTAALSSCNKRDSDILDAGMPKKAKKGRSPPKGEVEAFLAAAERESSHALRFATKYNYDVVKDAPMDGRYEWVRVRP